jgi:hypothetical protein
MLQRSKTVQNRGVAMFSLIALYLASRREVTLAPAAATAGPEMALAPVMLALAA